MPPDRDRVRADDHRLPADRGRLLALARPGARPRAHRADPPTVLSDDRLTPLDAAAAPRPARDVVGALRLDEPVGDRPRVAAAMIVSADGRAQLTDRSVGLGNAADRALLRELRTGADAVLAGTRTLHAERYATLLDDDQREHRLAHGRAPHPVVVTVSRRLDVPVAEIPLFDEAGVPIVVATEEQTATLEGCDADVEVARFTPGTLDFPGVLAHLADAHGVRGVSCEGGPGLLRQLIAQECLDDLLVTVAPKLVAGETLTMLTGDRFGDTGIDLALADVHRAGDHLFLHYTREHP
ncbi:hypothetical protein GKE82_04395 [Conexibacter sp. W3-3-2]|nr:hypothetical protein [Conexibacter sp. W3-3-2]